MSANSPARLATRKLGRAAVEVTELGLGTAPLGENWDIIEEEEASALLRAAWDGGVRYFDTSPWYGKGQAEHRVGRVCLTGLGDGSAARAETLRVLEGRLAGGAFHGWVVRSSHNSGRLRHSACPMDVGRGSPGKDQSGRPASVVPGPGTEA